MSSNLIVLAGIPGSGKTTWAKTFFDLKNSIITIDPFYQKHYALAGVHCEDRQPHIDDEARNAYYNTIEEHLRHGLDVIADGGHLRKKMREALLEIGWRNNAKTHLVFFKNVFEGEMRNKRRAQEVPIIKMMEYKDLYEKAKIEILQESWDTITKIESFQ